MPPITRSSVLRTGRWVRHRALRPSLVASILISILVLTIHSEVRADKTTASQPAPVVAAGTRVDADAAEVEGPERLVDRMRWFRQGRLGADGEIPPDARNRAFKQVEEHIRQGILRAQPTTLTSGDEWSQVGPSPLYDQGHTFSGRITAIAVDPTNGSTAYIGAAQGGVWKTTDHGATWTPLTDAQPSLAVGAVAIDPSSPNVVYAGTGEANNSCDSYFGAGILKSTDGGSTWTVVGATSFARSSVSRIIVHPTDSNILWASDTGGAGGFVCYAQAPPVQSGVWKSIDGGTTWTRVLNGNVHDLVIDPTNANTLYAGVDQDGIWKSTDGGSTWTRLATGLPASSTIGRVAVAINPNVPSTLYAIFSNRTNGTQVGGTYRTNNGGTTWTLLTTKPSGSCQYWNFKDACTYTGSSSGQCWYDLVIGVAPDGGVWIGGTGVWRSGNAGSTWTAVCPLNVHPDQHALAFKGTDVWLGNDGGVFTTADNGASWTSRNSGLAITQFYPGGALHPTDAEVAIGGAQDNGSLLFSGSLAWNLLLTGDGAANAFDFTAPETVRYVSFQYLTIAKTIDGGASWFYAVNGITDAGTTRANFIAPFVMCPHDSQILVAGSNKVWRTTDGAGNWSLDSPDPLGARITSLAFAASTGDCGTYFAGDQVGSVFRTTSAGADWSNIASGLPGLAVNDIAVDPSNAAVVIVGLSGFGSGHVWRSTNALDPTPIWTAIDAGIPDVPVNAVLIDPTASNVLYLGTDVGIFRSTDGGTSWQVFMGGHPNVAVFDLVANANTGTILSFTHGRSVFKNAPFCSDGNVCTTDTYDQVLGCQHTAVSCDDANACTIDSCNAATGCAHAGVVCGALDQCHDAGACDSGSGICSNPPKPDGTACDDGNACTADTCLAGACAGTSIPVSVVNDSVRVSATGTDAEVSWTDAPGSFNVYRGSLSGAGWSYNQTCFAPMVLGPVPDTDVPLTGTAAYYLITRETACGESSLGEARPNPNTCP